MTDRLGFDRHVHAAGIAVHGAGVRVILRIILAVHGHAGLAAAFALVGAGDRALDAAVAEGEAGIIAGGVLVLHHVDRPGRFLGRDAVALRLLVTLHRRGISRR